MKCVGGAAEWNVGTGSGAVLPIYDLGAATIIAALPCRYCATEPSCPMAFRFHHKLASRQQSGGKADFHGYHPKMS